MSPAPYRPVQPNHRPSDTFLLVPDVADLLAVSRMTVYRLIERGELPAFRIGRSLRVRERDLDAYLRGVDTTGWVTS